MSIGIFYGSTTGNTESAAQTIAANLGVADADVHNVGEASADDVQAYDTLLLGSSTWGCGDLQDDWFDFLDTLTDLDLSGKKVALFGWGDSSSYPDTYCGALAQIYDALQQTGAEFIGSVDAEGYSVTDSDSCRDGRFVGLALDEADSSDVNDARIQAWCEALASA